MQQATFTISGAELTQELLDKIQQLFKGKKGQDIEVFIRVKAKETQEDANSRINRAIENIEQQKNLVTFSPEGYDALVKSLQEK